MISLVFKRVEIMSQISRYCAEDKADEMGNHKTYL